MNKELIETQSKVSNALQQANQELFLDLERVANGEPTVTPAVKLRAEGNKLEAELKRQKGILTKLFNTDFDSQFQDFYNNLEATKQFIKKQNDEERELKKQAILQTLPNLKEEDIQSSWLNKGTEMADIQQEIAYKEAMEKVKEETEEQIKKYKLTIEMNGLTQDDVLKAKTELKLMGYVFSSSIKEEKDV